MIKKLSEISYYQTGGTFDALHMPQSNEELCSLVAELQRNHTPFFLIGAGTNSLVMDEHWSGAVICLTQMNSLLLREKNVVEVQAGADNSAVAEFCADHGLDGASWLYRLPGQIGASIRMNARCYGGELKNIVVEVHSVSPEGRRAIFPGEQVFTGYKQTIFQENRHVISSAFLQLELGDQATIRGKMRQHAEDRQAKQQFLYPSCGCVFKNNYEVSIPSGKLLQDANVQSLRSNRAMVSPYHANFVFNLGGATSREILELTLQMRKAVFDMFGVWLEYEMQILGNIPADLAASFHKK